MSVQVQLSPVRPEFVVATAAVRELNSNRYTTIHTGNGEASAEAHAARDAAAEARFREAVAGWTREDMADYLDTRATLQRQSLYI